MKKYLLLAVALILVGAMLVGCVAESTSVLDKIQKAKKVSVGTSADYPPYEYLDDAGNKTGFDIELMEEIAKRMGVELEWVDMPFDSLVAAVAGGKLDMSISCFNYDEERDEIVDFSEAYYTTEDAFVVTSAFAGTITAPEDVANYKVGVQSGTVQDGWLTDNLVTPGLLPEANLSREDFYFGCKFWTFQNIAGFVRECRAARQSTLQRTVRNYQDIPLSKNEQ